MFINNEEKLLGERLYELIVQSKELKFLVGFFYFSGFREIYEALSKNPSVQMKVLIGLSDDDVIGQIVERSDVYSELSDKEKFERFLQRFPSAFNHEQLDNREFYEQAKFFLNLLKEDRLKLRKTPEPNHAKLYIFKLRDDSPIPRIAIVGSSNLTSAGLSSQKELNIENRDEFQLEKLEKYFDEQWEAANHYDLNKPEIKQRIIQAVENNSPIKSITPYEAFIYLLYLYQELYLSESKDDLLVSFLKRKNYMPLQYQLDAVEQAVKILEVHNGVILADVVGLGKSIIASLIAKQLKCRGIVIAPPGLIGDREQKTSGWSKYLEDFELYDWEIFSSGKLEEALERAQHGNFEAVIVDEVHRFRNPGTESYAMLHSICRNKKVILLTATPFNNRPSDVYSYLKLFTIPRKSSLVLWGNLEWFFDVLEDKFEKLTYVIKNHNSPDEKKWQKARKYYIQHFNLYPKGEVSIDVTKVQDELRKIASHIRKTIEPVVIRRNRLDLKEDPIYKKEINQLPTLHDPMSCFYELTKEQNDFYDKVIRDLFAETHQGKGDFFKGAIYRPYLYTGNSKENVTQNNLYHFMRRLLVKRFESSWYAFERSIKNFIDLNVKALDFIDKYHYFVLNKSVMNKILELGVSDMSENEIYELILQLFDASDKDKFIYPISQLNEQFILDIRSDITMFNKILSDIKRLRFEANDPKVEKLKEVLFDIVQKKGQKAIIFSEFVDTITYLDNSLREFRKISVSDTPSKEVYRQLLANFDASIDRSQQRNDYDVLIVTDRFSEGYNFNRANHIINYDIPWNPVRVIQRVGRINRIGTVPFKDLYLYNFFPTLKGEEQIKLKEIAQQKMFMIHQCLGEDAKIFSEDEEPTPSKLYERLNANPDEYDEKTAFITQVRRILSENKEVVKKIQHLPNHIKVAKKHTADQLILAVKRNHVLHFFTAPPTNGTTDSLTLEDVFPDIACSKDEPLLELSENFWPTYEKLKETYREKLKQTQLSLPQRRETPQTIEKAFANLQQLTEQNPQWLHGYRHFVDHLKIDMQYFGSLPNIVISKISRWDLSQKNKIIDDLENFQKWLGQNFISTLQDKAKLIKSEIIIAIENQREK